MKHIQATVKLLSGLSLGLMLQTAWAGNITDIKVTSLTDSKKIVKIKFDRDVVEPKGFVTGTPPTIALDFGQTGINLAQQDFQYNDSLLGKILAAESNGRARLAIDLRSNSEYYTERKGDEIWVYITSKNAIPNITESVKTTATNTSTIKNNNASSQLSSNNSDDIGHSGVGIDFKKGNGGRGEVTLNLPTPNTRFNVQKNNDRLIITLPDTSINAAEQKKLDVTTFGTPVRFVNLTRNNAQTQLEIVTSGPWSYQNKLENGRQVFHILPQSNIAQAGLIKKNQNFKGTRVTLDFQDVEVRTILQILAKESGMNIVASDSVRGNMTISLKDVPWDQALQLVMDSRNLDKRQNGNIIKIAPREELIAQEKEELTNAKELENLGPLLSQSFQLKYKSVEEFKTVLDIKTGSSNSGDTKSILSARGSALIDPATNTLIINDVSSVIKKMQALVEELDVPSQQVMVEARIVSATTNFGRELGVRWFGQHTSSSTKPSTGIGSAIPSSNTTTTGNNAWAGPMGFSNSPSVNLGVQAATSSIAIVRQTLSGALGLELSAAESEGKTKTISSPRVLTQNGKKAEIKSGTEVPYQEASSSGATSVSFKEAVLGLTVTPRITPDGNIIMDLDVTNDSVDSTCTASEPCIKTNNLNSTVMVENGGTIIVGGIYKQDLNNATSKVPLLGDIPVLGNLFKYQKKVDNQEELLIFITPRIMSATGSNLRY
ncbi:type IV pilus secretin PilQ family protein [Vitreoscilla massiliensis]|uniref:Type IV pilus biogenesis and competence protein PilQ n=1 Tax=Vitreoscilla massiliensis TaxID=1689272 RepID=A0ABY4E3P0_9NEIS|nr:type IV pilus secretin PilQ family protein [Vitreoscilla massiliensis]UOO90399.1 type IV pilus secretin PilQ family protein [Vitreoscilla massiliensis]